MASGVPGSPTSPRSGIRRNNSTSAVHSFNPVVDAATKSSSRTSGRASMDSFDRARFFRPSASDTIMSSSPPRTKSWHKKSSSSPSNLLSPPLAPHRSPSTSIPGTPSLTSLASIPAVVIEDEVEPLDIRSSVFPQSSSTSSVSSSSPSFSSSGVGMGSSSMFFGRTSATSTPAGTPPASPGLRAAATSNISASPSPSTTPPSSPSPSFMATWNRLPSIPRPSPMTPFRAARKVVTSVTAAGTGFLPSKEQLGSIPVAGRIIKHPVMDSTLNYIASKTMHRGANSTESKVILPEDIHYRKLSRRLTEQAITLATLAIEKEELSKTLDDEEGDDAFELYLASISTLMHALPIETCDPLRREAFEGQLRGFLLDHEMDSADEDTNEKRRRRRRRHRHRRHHDQATSLIDQHALVLAGTTKTSASSSHMIQSRSRRRRSRRDSRGDGRISTGSTLGDTIITTAVQSAIRLKQSPIPDVIKTCIRTSQTILARVDQRFNLQERAWQFSKQSIEKAIELDEQYAIHEVMAETFFATMTGLVKAGIAYKETPGYMSLKALTGPPTAPGFSTSTTLAIQVSPSTSSKNPQAIKDSFAIRSSKTSSRRKYSIIAEEGEEDIYQKERREDASDDERSGHSSTSSSSCFTSSEEDEGMLDEEFEASLEGKDLLSVAAVSLSENYSEQVRQKVGLFMALKNAASMILSGPA